MKNHLFLGCLVVLSAMLPKAIGAPPNIVLIIADDMGYGDISAHGHPLLKTPSLDRLRSESVCFIDFNVSPTCAPTRSALMTGRHEFKNGVTHTINERERLTLKATTLPEVLKRAGYTSGIFGKWHLGDEPQYWPSRRGFDEMFIHGGGGIGQTFPGSCGDAPGNQYFDPAVLHNGTFEKTKGYCTDVFFERATQWIDTQRKSGKLFFAYIPVNVPHSPIVSPGPKYESDYEGKSLHGRVLSKLDSGSLAMLANLDENIGKLLARLDEWDIARNTLVIFLTDNGAAISWMFNAGMRGSKGTPYLGGTRVPCFWRWPAGFSGGVDCPALAAHVDLLPTLADIAGIKLTGDLERQVEGRSLFALLKDPKSAWPDRILVTHVGRWPRGGAAEAKFRNCSIRNSRFKLVNNTELYDLQLDPGEKTNVISAYPAVVAKLREAYDRWWEEIQPCLVNEQVVGPKINPFKEVYWKQFGGGPDAALLKQMDPERQ